MDFVTGTRELDEMDAIEREKAFVPTTKWEKFLDWVSLLHHATPLLLQS